MPTFDQLFKSFTLFAIRFCKYVFVCKMFTRLLYLQKDQLFKSFTLFAISKMFHTFVVFTKGTSFSKASLYLQLDFANMFLSAKCFTRLLCLQNGPHIDGALSFLWCLSSTQIQMYQNVLVLQTIIVLSERFYRK